MKKGFGKSGVGLSLSVIPFAAYLFGLYTLISPGDLLAQSDQAENAQQSEPDTSLTLNLKNADIHSLIQTVSKRTGRNFIVDPRVSAKVTVVSSEPLDANKLYDLFLSVLDIHGFAAVDTGSFIKIVPLTVGVQSAVPVLKSESAKAEAGTGDELVTEVVHVEYHSAQQMIEVLRPLLPAAASISAESHSNSLVITDRASNISRLVQLVRQLDNSE